MQSKTLKFYSLLHVDLKKNHKNVNIQSSVENPIDVYINCGRLLAASCRYFNVHYAIITNQPDFVKKRVDVLGGGVEILDGVFDRDVPENISFHSAHFKLDLLRDFGKGLYGSYVALIDLDVVLTKPIDFSAFFKYEEALFVYDISTEELASYGEQKILNSLYTIGANFSSIPSWYGGEFIAGSSNSFERLTAAIDYFWPLYVEKYPSLHHMGDEMVVTAALSKMLHENFLLINSGNFMHTKSYPLISRWWSSRTLCKQKSFKIAAEAAFLHLPADKSFLANFSNNEFNPDKFIDSYRSYASKKLFSRKIFNYFNNLRNDRKHFVSSLY
jgi:hypothetical protein